MAAYIVTFKLPRNPHHDPTNKVTGKCLVSEECTDVTGQHHSTLIIAKSVEEIREGFSARHITRIERV